MKSKTALIKKLKSEVLRLKSEVNELDYWNDRLKRQLGDGYEIAYSRGRIDGAQKYIEILANQISLEVNPIYVCTKCNKIMEDK